MKFLKEHIDEIKRRLSYLEEHFNIDISDNLEIFEDEDIEELISTVNEIDICFPDECENTSYSSEDFWKYTDDLEHIKTVDNSTVRNSVIRQTILDINEYDYEKYNINQYSLITDDYVIRIIDNPFLIGLIASKEGLCDDNCCITPCSMYSAIEIEYLNSNKLTIEEENNIIERFLFFVSARIGTSIKIGRFFTFLYDDDYNEEENRDDEYHFNMNDIPKYTLAMQYYVQ